MDTYIRINPIEAVQYTCSEDRWSNTLEILDFSHLEWGRVVKHFPVPRDPHDRYGIEIDDDPNMDPLFLYPDWWIVRNEHGILTTYPPDQFIATFTPRDAPRIAIVSDRMNDARMVSLAIKFNPEDFPASRELGQMITRIIEDPAYPKGPFKAQEQGVHAAMIAMSYAREKLESRMSEAFKSPAHENGGKP